MKFLVLAIFCSLSIRQPSLAASYLEVPYQCTCIVDRECWPAPSGGTVCGPVKKSFEDSFRVSLQGSPGVVRATLKSEAEGECTQICRNEKWDSVMSSADIYWDSVKTVKEKVAVSSYKVCTGNWSCDLSCWEATVGHPDWWCRIPSYPAQSPPHYGASYSVVGTGTVGLNGERNNEILQACMKVGLRSQDFPKAGTSFHGDKRSCQTCVNYDDGTTDCQ